MVIYDFLVIRICFLVVYKADKNYKRIKFTYLTKQNYGMLLENI